MRKILPANAIAALWKGLETPPPRAKPREGAKLLWRIADEGWASKADIEDIFFLFDSRLDQAVNIDELCHAFELPWRTTFYRPKSRSNSVSGFDALAATDLAELLIEIERLGFLLDATSLVDALIPKIRLQKRITDSELSVLWYTKCRHKNAPQEVRAAPPTLCRSRAKKND